MIARRYLLPGKGEGFIFLVAGISLAAVMLGVAALIIVMSVMNGFRAELFDKVVGLNGHAVVQGYGGRLDNWRPILEQARRTPGVVSAQPLIEQPLMASHEGRVEAILLRGMPREDILTNPTISAQRRSPARSPRSARAATMSRSARASPNCSASASAARSPSSRRRAGRRRSARCRGSSTITSPRSSRSASTISTRRSWSCRWRRRRTS